MTTIKVKLRLSTVKGKEGTLIYQVIHKRVARQINTGYRLFPSEWDHQKSVIIFPSTECDRMLHLQQINEHIATDIKQLTRIIRELNHTDLPYSCDRIVECFRYPLNQEGFISFGKQLVAKLRQMGRNRTADTYATVQNSFIRFCGNRCDISMKEVNAGLMIEYENYLKSHGICPNSISYYMRNLRAIYNRAVEEGLTPQRNPFRHVYTGIDKTVKRAVPMQVVRRIRELNLTSFPALDYARDMFLFSFYTRGMSFVDMAFLKKSDLQHGILSYRRQKTGQQLFIKWEKPMQAILDKYDTQGSHYLLPIIKDCEKDERRQYLNAAHLVNQKLKRVGAKLKLSHPLTMYVARHAWASIAHSKNIPLSVISEGMGHDSESTTRIYLASLDASAIDKANRVILKSI
ncbi:MAG: site-specific integrase [Bacteroides sp.]|nr:site-specific integrase [Bacteroides sp.]